MDELEIEVNKELDILKLKKQNLLTQINQKYLNPENISNQSDISHLVNENKILFEKLKDLSSKIQNGVEVISYSSTNILKNFETLKNKKKNLENVLNAITALVELRKIIPLLEKTIKDNNIDECIKIVKKFKGFEKFLLTKYCEIELRRIHILIEDLKDLVRKEFEAAIKKNATEKIEQLTNVARLLEMEDNSLSKIMKIYSQQLNENLSSLSVKLNTFPLSHKNVNLENYELIFFQHFVDILGKIAITINNCKTIIFQYFQQDGALTLFDTLINSIADPYIKELFFKMTIFYDLNNISQNAFNSKNNQQNILRRIDLFCEEISNISNQNENFIKHHIGLFKEFKKILEVIDLPKIENKLRSSMMNGRVTELLGKFINFEQIFLKQQLLCIIESSASFKSFSNFNKNFFTPYVNQNQCLSNFTAVYEYLDEVFFLAKSTGLRALFTLNPTTICAILTHIANSFFLEEFYTLISSILSKYIRKENFSTSMISFDPLFKLHNSFLIILLNNLDLIPSYLLKLKEGLREEWLGGIGVGFEGEEGEGGGVESCFEEVERVGNRFEEGRKERIRIVVEFLKMTFKKEIELFNNVDFELNESGLGEYEKRETFSKEFKSFLNVRLQQWNIQFTKNNFEQFLLCLCENLSKTFEYFIMNKKFTQIGAILLDKEIRSLINFFQSLVNINVKRCFSRLSYITEILMLENMKDVEQLGIGMGELSLEEIKKIMKLRTDLI